MQFFRSNPKLPSPADSLPGRAETMPIPEHHYVNGASLTPPWPDGTRTAIFAMGCFWGAEKVFWENHDPTQGMRQGNDVGTQYRSAIFATDDEQLRMAIASRNMYQARLSAAGYGEVTTEIASAPTFFYAEDYHQQYLAKNPNGYCPNHRTGVKLPDDFVVTPLQYVD